MASMVVNLSVGKGEFDDRYEQLCSIAERAQAVKDRLVRMVDEDTQAFDTVLTGMRMPQDTEEERALRSAAIQEGYKTATLVPLGTAEGCLKAMTLCQEMGAMATPEMISDVGSGALMAHAGLKSAIYNVRINLPNISDEAFDQEVRGKLDGLLKEADEAARAVEGFVEDALAS